MKSIVCQSCGGVLSSQPGKVIICEFCGRAYTKTAEDGKTVVVFTNDEGAVKGMIEDGKLTIPTEWQDSHGHGSVLPKK